MWLVRLITAVVLFAGLSEVGAQQLPPPAPAWQVVKTWVKEDGVYRFEARSRVVVEQCRESPESYLSFPFTQQVAQVIRLDGVVIKERGSPDLSTLYSYYGMPVVKCARIVDGEELVWNVYSSAKSFARIHDYPQVVAARLLNNFFNESLNVIAAGALPFMGITALILFWRSLSRPLLFSLSLSCIFHGFYFLSTVPGFFNIELPALTLQKFGDTSLWIGALLFFNCLRLSGLVGHWLYLTCGFTIVISCLVILTANDLDAAQVGTSVPFITSIVVMLAALGKEFQRVWRHGSNFFSLCLVVSLSVYVFSGIHDILTVEGYLSGYMFYAGGVTIGLLFYVFFVYAQIAQTYQERDYLRHNLEREVKQKTAALEQALLELKSTESELIQSAKMASLGTLAAGIAHEINNSLNFVSGSVKPLQKIVAAIEPETARAKAQKLLQVMAEGLALTFDIINSLRSYSGLNQARMRDVNLRVVVQGVLTILKSRLVPTIEVKVEIDEGLILFADAVALNQILMNLITNALDAMGEQGREGRLLLRAREESGAVVIDVRDTGPGMTSEQLERIFEPFYTTKEVGKGSGIGLHIVSSEMHKQGGEVTVRSTPGEGSCFTLRFPMGKPSLEMSTEVEAQ